MLFINYLIFQYPFLGIPILSIKPFSLNFAIFLFTVILEISSASAISNCVILLSDFIRLNIFFSVLFKFKVSFWVSFWVSFDIFLFPKFFSVFSTKPSKSFLYTTTKNAVFLSSNLTFKFSSLHFWYIFFIPVPHFSISPDKNTISAISGFLGLDGSILYIYLLVLLLL